jgi:hypothetical protein
MSHQLSCAAGTSGHVVLANTPLAPDVHRLVVRAPRVAEAGGRGSS